MGKTTLREAVQTRTELIVNESMYTGKTSSWNSVDAKVGLQADTPNTVMLTSVRSFTTKQYTTGTTLRYTNGTSAMAHNVTFAVNDRNQTLTDREKEVINAFSASATSPQVSSMVSESAIWDCLRRNGSLHYKFTKTTFVSFVEKHDQTESGHSLTCWIRWTAIDLRVGTVFRILYRECASPDHIISVHEMNVSARHKREMKELAKICGGTLYTEYYGQTNEILILVRIKDVPVFSKFFIELTTRSLRTLETHYGTDKGENQCILDC